MLISHVSHILAIIFQEMGVAFLQAVRLTPAEAREELIVIHPIILAMIISCIEVKKLLATHIWILVNHKLLIVPLERLAFIERLLLRVGHLLDLVRVVLPIFAHIIRIGLIVHFSIIIL